MQYQLIIANRLFSPRRRYPLRAGSFIGIAVIFLAVRHGAAQAKSSVIQGSTYTVTRLMRALDDAESTTIHAERNQVSSPTNLGAFHRFTAEVTLARRQWSEVMGLTQKCQQRAIPLPATLKLKAQLDNLFFLTRYGLAPAEAADRLQRMLRGAPKLKYSWEVNVALLASLASGMLGPGETMYRLPNGKWSKPKWHMPTPAEARRSRLDRELSLRYALRAAVQAPLNPVTGYMLFKVPLPRPYSKLQFWGGCVFLARWRTAKEWYRYSGTPIRQVLGDITWNTRHNAPDVFAKIQDGVWKPAPPVFPTWRQMKEALKKSNKTPG